MHGILTTASKSDENTYRYNVATVPLLAELLKLCVSAVLLRLEIRRNSNVQMTMNVKSIALYPFPSLIFLLHHSLAFPALQYLDPSTFQVLGNLKIVTTVGGGAVQAPPRLESNARFQQKFTTY